MIAESFVNQLGLPAKPVQRESTFFEGLSQGAESGQAGACGKERLAKIASAVGDVATAFDESFGIQPEELLELQLLQAAEKPGQRCLRDFGLFVGCQQRGFLTLAADALQRCAGGIHQ